jgi:hypothetical protein
LLILISPVTVVKYAKEVCWAAVVYTYLDHLPNGGVAEVSLSVSFVPRAKGHLVKGYRGPKPTVELADLVEENRICGCNALNTISKHRVFGISRVHVALSDDNESV